MKIDRDIKLKHAGDATLVESLRALCAAEIVGLRLTILFGSCGKRAERSGNDIDLAVLAKGLYCLRSVSR